MPVLFLMRHGTAEAGDRDFDRALTAQGRLGIQALGKNPAITALRPGRLLCSPARRTRQTMEELTRAAGFSTRVDYENAIYDATPGTLYEIVKDIGDEHDTAGLVGHNPGIHSLAAWLAGDGRGDPALLHDLRSRYLPGTMAILTFDGSWSDLGPGAATLTALLSPA